MRVRTNVGSDEVNYRANHKLFVEGKKNSIDIHALRTLLDNEIAVEGMGPATHIKSVATALHPFHPSYYFLVDRDHYSDEDVENSWKNFPDPEKSNLLIWRKRMIENYFLDPAFLSESSYLKPSSHEKLKSKILKHCQERLYLDLVRMVIIDIRETLKGSWINLPKNPELFPDKDTALNFLLNLKAMKERPSLTSEVTSEDNILELFERKYHLISNAKGRLAYGEGQWLNQIDGKPILNSVLSSGLFENRGSNVGVDEYSKDILKDLIRSAKNLPSDFVELRSLIGSVVKKPWQPQGSH